MDKFIQNLARGAGKILRDGYKKKYKVNTKTGPGDLVTEYDYKSEKFIIAEIKKKFPDHGIMSEESGVSGNRKDFWMIDPLDGTRGFVKKLHQFAVPIAFVSGDEVQMAAVYIPINDELFFAAKGKGAFLNNKRIRCSNVSELYAAVASPLFLKSNQIAKKVYNFILDNDMSVFVPMSAALNIVYFAAGRIDLMFAHGSFPWDYAIGGLIAAESGARVTEIDGQAFRWDSKSILVANPKLHKQVLQKLKL